VEYVLLTGFVHSYVEAPSAATGSPITAIVQPRTRHPRPRIVAIEPLPSVKRVVRQIDADFDRHGPTGKSH
jgi:hypothetical protein